MLVEKLQRVAGGSLFEGTVCFYQQAPKSDQNALLGWNGHVGDDQTSGARLLYLAQGRWRT
jgi:hypothetical protein